MSLIGASTTSHAAARPHRSAPAASSRSGPSVIGQIAPKASFGATSLSAAIERTSGSGADPAAIAEAIRRKVKPEAIEWILLAESGVLRWEHAPGNWCERALDRADLNVVHAGLSVIPWAETKRLLADRMTASPTESRARFNALRIHGALATAGEASLLLRVAQPETRMSRAMRGALRSSLAALFARHPSAAESIAAEVRQLEEPLIASVVAPVVGALEELGTRAAVRGLARCQGLHPDADALVATAVARVAKVLHGQVSEQTASALRAGLRSEDATVRLETVKALGRFDDVASIPQLIDSLSDPELRVRRAAYRALEVVTGERQIPEAEMWTKWHADAVQWREVDLPALRTQLRNGAPQIAHRALLEIARYRVFRHSLSKLLVEASQSPDESLVAVAAATLGHFGTRECVVALTGLLDHSSLEVKRAAFIALRRATGEDHGDQSSAWRIALEIKP